MLHNRFLQDKEMTVKHDCDKSSCRTFLSHRVFIIIYIFKSNVWRLYDIQVRREKALGDDSTTVSAAGGKSQAFIDLSIVVKNINMPRMKNTIPSPFFVVSLFVARLRWRHGSRGGAIITTRE